MVTLTHLSRSVIPNAALGLVACTLAFSFSPEPANAFAVVDADQQISVGSVHIFRTLRVDATADDGAVKVFGDIQVSGGLRAVLFLKLTNALAGITQLFRDPTVITGDTSYEFQVSELKDNTIYFLQLVTNVSGSGDMEYPSVNLAITEPSFPGVPVAQTVDSYDASDLLQAPEPATLALFGLGLAGLGLVRRKRAT